MILIFANYDDFLIHRVIDWLTFYRVSFIIIFSEEEISVKFLGSENAIISIKDRIIDLATIKACLSRTRNFSLAKCEYSKSISDEAFKKICTENEIVESEIYTSYLRILLNNKKILGSTPLHDNKLIAIQIAGTLGIGVPITAIFTSKNDVINYFSGLSFAVSKIATGSFHFIGNKFINSYSEIINFDELPERFPPSLLQEFIEKKCDVRCVFFNNEIYSMAIFTRQKESKNIDINKLSIRNRIFVPFNLPREFKSKLVKLMNQMRITLGCIDLIMAKNGQLFFLEVNPFGFLSNVSYYCNYNLEKEISDFLIS